MKTSNKISKTCRKEIFKPVTIQNSLTQNSSISSLQKKNKNKECNSIEKDFYKKRKKSKKRKEKNNNSGTKQNLKKSFELYGILRICSF
jgi:hypothetical protein